MFSLTIEKQPPEVFYKRGVFKMLQNAQEDTCENPNGLSLLLSSRSQIKTILKKRIQHRCFPVNYAKLLRTPFLLNTSR